MLSNVNFFLDVGNCEPDVPSGTSCVPICKDPFVGTLSASCTLGRWSITGTCASPQPSPQPSPAPQPSPSPQPSPAPQPTPAPQPQPTPSPQPQPTPNPVPPPPPPPPRTYLVRVLAIVHTECDPTLDAYVIFFSSPKFFLNFRKVDWPFECLPWGILFPERMHNYFHLGRVYSQHNRQTSNYFQRYCRGNSWRYSLFCHCGIFFWKFLMSTG